MCVCVRKYLCTCLCTCLWTCLCIYIIITVWGLRHIHESIRACVFKTMWAKQYAPFLHTCTYEYTDTYFHTYTHTHIHTYIHTYIYIHTCIHVHINARTYIHAQTLQYDPKCLPAGPSSPPPSPHPTHAMMRSPRLQKAGMVLAAVASP